MIGFTIRCRYQTAVCRPERNVVRLPLRHLAIAMLMVACAPAPLAPLVHQTTRDPLAVNVYATALDAAAPYSGALVCDAHLVVDETVVCRAMGIDGVVTASHVLKLANMPGLRLGTAGSFLAANASARTIPDAIPARLPVDFMSAEEYAAVPKAVILREGDLEEVPKLLRLQRLKEIAASYRRDNVYVTLLSSIGYSRDGKQALTYCQFATAGILVLLYHDGARWCLQDLTATWPAP